MKLGRWNVWITGGVTALVLCSGAGAAVAQEAKRSVTMDQCVREAMTLHPTVRQAQFSVQAAEASQKSTRGSFGPSLKVEGSVIRWDQEQKTSFSSGGSVDVSLLPPPTTVYEQLIAGMLGGSSSGTVMQEQITWSVSATLAQPITPLWTVYKAYELGELGIDLAYLQEEDARLAAAYGVIEAYYGHLQAHSVAAVILTSIRRVQAALAQVEKLKDAKLVGKGDVLKVKSALASVLQSDVQARNVVELTRAALAAQVGWDVMVVLEPADIPKELPGQLPLTLQQAIAQAVENRVELQQLRKQLAQLGIAEEIVWAEYIPTLVAVGTYTHAEGNRFRKEDSYFIGLNLSWTVFEWGKTWYQVDENRARVRQLQAAFEMATNYIGLEVKRAWLDFNSAFENLKAVEARIEQSEENFRIQSKLYEEQYKTSTDLLEAEADLTEATAQREMAFYKLWMARATLGKAMGQPVEQWYPKTAAQTN